MTPKAHAQPEPTTAGSKSILRIYWIVDPLIVLAMTLALYRVFVFTSATFNTGEGFTDLVKLTQATYTYTGERLAAGDLPLWNPYWFSGYPHLAMPSASVFYPTTILFGWLPFAQAVKIVVLGHVYLLGCFAYLLGRDLFRDRVAAIALAAGLIGGTFAGWPLVGGHVWNIQSITWFPLAFLCLRRMLYGGGGGWMLGMSLSVMLTIFGGDPQFLLYALYWLGVYTALDLAFRFATRAEPTSALLAKGGLALAGVVLGIALAGVQIVPSRELFAESIRSGGLTYEYMRGRFAPDASSLWTNLVTTHKPIWFSPGKLALALAVLALIVRGSYERFVWLGAFVACSLYAFLPRWFYDLLIQHVPSYNAIRSVSRMSQMMIFTFILAAACGLHALIRRDPEEERGRPWTLFAVLVALGSAIPFFYDNEVYVFGLVLGAAGVALAVAGARLTPSARMVGLLLVAVVAIEWGQFNNGGRAGSDPAAYKVNRDFRAFSEAREAEGDLSRVAIFLRPGAARLAHGQTVGLLTGDRVFAGYHDLMLRRYVNLIQGVTGLPLAEHAEDGRLSGSRVGLLHEDWVNHASLAVLGLFNVRYLVVDRAALTLPEVETERFVKRHEGILTVYENRVALPPAQPVHKVIVCDTDEEAIAVLSAPGFDFSKAVTITGQFDVSRLAPATGVEEMGYETYEPDYLKLRVNMTAPGILMFSEMYYPGWKVRVDGGEWADPLCVDTAFRGVFLDAGERRVELEFRPASLRWGALLTGVGALVWFAWAVSVLRRRGKRVRQNS